MTESAMGVFSVKARIWNVREPARSTTVDLLVDTGSTYTVIPAGYSRI
ncbi:hypothetical protein [Vulcanisaeta distributa]|nr:hypothetical protein [Vulcanisaeta distributa]